MLYIYFLTIYQIVNSSFRPEIRNLRRVLLHSESILGPVLFNLYVSDMQDKVSSTTMLQYADDTMFYTHDKFQNLQNCLDASGEALNELQSWCVSKILHSTVLKPRLCCSQARDSQSYINNRMSS